MKSLSFDNLIDLYDETRDFDIESFNNALQFLKEAYPPEKYVRFFEPGIGNGRIALPLSKLGYTVYGIDISQKMLEQLAERIQKYRISTIYFQKGDVTSVPYDTGYFDAALATHLFYFIKDWKSACDEIMRVTKGPIVLFHTGMGREIDVLNDSYKKKCKKYGVKIPVFGVTSTKEAISYFCSNGYKVIADKKWSWKKTVDYDKAIYYIKNRAYSFTIWANDKIHNKVIDELYNEDFSNQQIEDRISLIILE